MGLALVAGLFSPSAEAFTASGLTLRLNGPGKVPKSVVLETVIGSNFTGTLDFEQHSPFDQRFFNRGQVEVSVKVLRDGEVTFQKKASATHSGSASLGIFFPEKIAFHTGDIVIARFKLRDFPKLAAGEQYIIESNDREERPPEASGSLKSQTTAEPVPIAVAAKPSTFEYGFNVFEFNPTKRIPKKWQRAFVAHRALGLAEVCVSEETRIYDNPDSNEFARRKKGRIRAQIEIMRAGGGSEKFKINGRTSKLSGILHVCLPEPVNIAKGDALLSSLKFRQFPKKLDGPRDHVVWAVRALRVE